MKRVLSNIVMLLAVVLCIAVAGSVVFAAELNESRNISSYQQIQIQRPGQTDSPCTETCIKLDAEGLGYIEPDDGAIMTYLINVSTNPVYWSTVSASTEAISSSAGGYLQALNTTNMGWKEVLPHYTGPIWFSGLSEACALRVQRLRISGK